MLTNTKSFNFAAIKEVKITPDMMAKINTFAPEALTEEKVYIRKFLIAHNGIDLDKERFSEPLLEDYARTLPGKSFLEVHNTRQLPIGLFFDARTETMTKEEFKSITGEEIILPDGVDSAKVVLTWLYILKADYNDKLIANLDAGIYRHISIGFSASGKAPVTDGGGSVLYYEYVGPGSAREGSLVYLGAQPGATSLKKSSEGAGGSPGDETEGNLLIPKDKMSIVPREDNLDEKNVQYIAPISSWEKEEKNSIIPSAKNAKERLVDNYVSLKIALGDASLDKQEHERDVARGRPVSFLESEIKTLKKRQNPLIPT